MLRLLRGMVNASSKSASLRVASCRNISRVTSSRKDFYDVLGVDRHSSSQQIKDAYIALSKKYHPDNDVGNPKLHSRFLEINEAYDALNTPHKRDMYELSRMERLAEELEARSNQRYHRYGRPLEKESKKKEIRWTVIIAGVKYTVNPFSSWTLLSLLLSSWLILSLVIYVLLILSW